MEVKGIDWYLFAFPEMPGIKVGASEQALQPGNYQVRGNNWNQKENIGCKIPFPQYVAWDLDTTGRRLIDEICQVIGDHLFGLISPCVNYISKL